MFLKIEKCKHKTQCFRTYVSFHLALDCVLKLMRTEVDRAVFTFK